MSLDLFVDPLCMQLKSFPSFSPPLIRETIWASLPLLLAHATFQNNSHTKIWRVFEVKSTYNTHHTILTCEKLHL